MPFTFCHPAIILPLTKNKKLSTSALILGSTAPDFEYFLRLDMIRTHSHDFWAIFYFNLPLTIILFYIYQIIVKQPLINNLPPFLKNRFKNYMNKSIPLFSINKIKWVIISSIIGIFSHLLWDSFTHKQGFFEGANFLTQKFIVNGKEYVVFQFLQIWSSIIGGFYILVFIIKRPAKGYSNYYSFIKFWVMAIGISLIVLYVRQHNTNSQFIATSIAGGLIGVIVTSTIYKTIDYIKSITILIKNN